MVRSFFSSPLAFSRASLRETRLLDALLHLGDLVATVLGLAKLLLDRLHLLVEIVLALRLLHLTLHAVADLLLDLQHADLAFHQAEDALEPLADRVELEQLLLLGDLERQVGGDRVGELGRLLDLVDRDDDLGRHLLVQLHVVLELRDHGARGRLQLGCVGRRLFHVDGVGFEELALAGVAHDLHAPAAFDQHLHGVVGQLQQLQHGAERADGVDVLGPGIVLAGVLLGDQQDLLVVLHDLFERLDALLAADEQRHDHAGKHDNVAQRKDGIGGAYGGGVHDCLATYAVRATRTPAAIPVMGDPRPAGTRTR